MIFGDKMKELENLKFKFDSELEPEPEELKEKIPLKDLIAITIAQYSIILPFVLGGAFIFWLAVFLIDRLMLMP